MKGKSLWHLRKIRQYDELFDTDDFAETAHEMYLDVHNTLAEGDLKKLEKLVIVSHELICITNED